MSKLQDSDISFLKLLLRSPDTGDGWRKVSSVVMPLVEDFSQQVLLEVDELNMRVRLSDEGRVIVGYLI